MAKTGVAPRLREASVLQQLRLLAPALRLLGIGWFFAGSIVGGGVVGLLADGWLDTSPLLTLVGLGIGLIVAFYGGYKLIVQYMSADEDEKGAR